MTFDNLGVINLVPLMLRSAQPPLASLVLLRHLGVRTIIRLNETGPISTEDQQAAWNHNGENSIVVAMDMHPTVSQLRSTAEYLHVAANQSWGCLIHCEHGRDRTGAVVAAYRMIHDGWDYERAEEERQSYFGPSLIGAVENLFDAILAERLKEIVS